MSIKILSLLMVVGTFILYRLDPHPHQMIHLEEKTPYSFLSSDHPEFNNNTFSEIELSVNANLINFSRTADREKVLAGLELLKSVINSEEFRLRVLNHQWDGQTQFANNEGLSNEEILEKILRAEEYLSPTTTYVIDLELSLYTPKWWQAGQRNVIGYTNPGEPRIYMNTNFFRGFTPAEVAGNLAHEWCHKLGFGHAFQETAERPYSVPYAVGYMVRDLGAKMKAPKMILGAH
jgi:hypothetical protein